ncbi:hypothetical protein Nos7524_5652 (plasmid) [Nostoc sp. PCC 7524]|uniref:hypothetical protein n=1 Tax=Nostoc sp. (strain ATCC 29411 / PCC 7524) TaxID=28072 RepID=UPI00029EDCC1|nr:hypothetical protein [Nostoc sp. PCC 7524]AFY51342.1 hypothetical protein Nos7524_5652 [Nostoc sp. PCC 7524]
MTNHYAEIRIMATQTDLQVWLWLLHKLQDDDKIIEIVEESKPYANRGESKLYRVYIKANLISGE